MNLIFAGDAEAADNWTWVSTAILTVTVIIFGETVLRVSPKFADAMHIDTDECNAACAFGTVYGEVIA